MGFLQTRIKRLLGAPYITARKTFTTYAGELEISDIIRRVLIGHVDQSMLSHYTNLNTLEFKQQVEDAHLKVLEKFRAYDLANELFDKLQAVDAPKWVNLTLESFDDLTQKDIDEMVKVKNIIKKAHKRKKGQNVELV